MPCAQADKLDELVAAQQKRLGGRIGLAVLDTQGGQTRGVNGELRFPMLGTLRVLVCGKLLAEADAGRASLAQVSEVVPVGNVPDSSASSTIKSMSLKQACELALARSDSAATNLVIDALGGPLTVTSFMKGLGDSVTRVDRMDPAFNSVTSGDPRDSSSPAAMAKALQALLFGSTLTAASRAQLQQWMLANAPVGHALREALPEGWRMAELNGSGGNGSAAAIAVVWPKERSPLILTLYLTQTRADKAELNRTLTLIGRELFALYR